MTYVSIPAVKAIMKSLLEPVDGGIGTARAGGTTLLTAVRADLTVVTLGDIDGPFGRIDDEGEADVEGFTVQVHKDWKHYISGDEPSYHEESGAGYDDLVNLLKAGAGGAGGPAKSVRGFSPYITTINEGEDLVVLIDWSSAYDGLAIGGETNPIDEAEGHPRHEEWLEVERRVTKLRKIRLDIAGQVVEISEDD